LPKPRGTIGSTKMKIMAVICYNAECGLRPCGYGIWRALKTQFHIYINDGDVRNVYHHLKELRSLELLAREEGPGSGSTKRCTYSLTEKGRDLRHRYAPYLEIVRRSAGSDEGLNPPPS